VSAPNKTVRRFDLVLGELREKPHGALVSADDYDALVAEHETLQLLLDREKRNHTTWRDTAKRLERQAHEAQEAPTDA
jgi:hypothetical protein